MIEIAIEGTAYSVFVDGVRVAEGLTYDAADALREEIADHRRVR